MSNNPIPTRFDDDLEAAINELSKTSGVSKAEVIRRAVRYALQQAKSKQSLDFLFGGEDKIRNMFDALEGLGDPQSKLPPAVAEPESEGNDTANKKEVKRAES